MVKRKNISFFYVFIGTFIFVFLAFIIIVLSAPHNDIKMRGFTPCTLEVAKVISSAENKPTASKVFASIGQSYICYLEVIKHGCVLWLEDKQPTPWTNYIFEPEAPELKKYEVEPELSEPFSQDLLQNNRLD